MEYVCNQQPKTMEKGLISKDSDNQALSNKSSNNLMTRTALQLLLPKSGTDVSLDDIPINL